MRTTIHLCMLLLLATGHALAGDEDEILDLLQHFLANAGVESAHERFWADDLVYTSSRGTRTTKAEIMASFDGEDDSGDRGPDPVYSADDIRFKQYGDMAVVAFRLVAYPPDDLPVLYYLNTGTFLKRNGEWRVVAWQATKVSLDEK